MELENLNTDTICRLPLTNITHAYIARARTSRLTLTGNPALKKIVECPSIRLRHVSRRAWKLGLEYNYASRRKVAPLFHHIFTIFLEYHHIYIYIYRETSKCFLKIFKLKLFRNVEIDFISCCKWIYTVSIQLLNSGARAKLLFSETGMLTRWTYFYSPKNLIRVISINLTLFIFRQLLVIASLRPCLNPSLVTG